MRVGVTPNSEPKTRRSPLVSTLRRPFLALAQRARDSECGRRAVSRRVVVVLLVAVLAAPAVFAQEVSKQHMQGLDEQVQEIKSDVLRIAAELGRLEERLLYPSNTQLAVFVSLAEGETLRLDSVQIQIDGQPVARHVYSFKEVEALQKGGMQRLYTGNVPTGEHRLDVSIVGKRDGKDLSAAETFTFSKDVEPKLVGITLAGGDSGTPSLQLGDW
jgi:hypothetical protein